MDYKPGDLVVIDGMEERIERITEVDIHSLKKIRRLSEPGAGCQGIFCEYGNHHKLDQSRKINARSAVQIRK